MLWTEYLEDCKHPIGLRIKLILSSAAHLHSSSPPVRAGVQSTAWKPCSAAAEVPKRGGYRQPKTNIYLSACLKSIIGMWGSRNWVMTSSEVCAIRTRRHFPRWLTGSEHFSTCGRCSVRTRMFINTRKTGFAMKESQCSGHLWWIRPWIQTFSSNCSGTPWWLTRPEYHLFMYHCSWIRKSVFMVWFSINGWNIDLLS